MYRTKHRKRTSFKRSKRLKYKSIGFKKRLANQKRKSKKYTHFRVSRGGIRL